MADTPTGETVVVDDSKTTVPVTTPTVTPEVKSNDSIVEQLRKEKEQAEMRANQLANQLKSREEAEAEARTKELEEQNKYKELLEQERAKNEQLASDLEERERRTELRKAKNEILAEYDDTVVEAAKEFGLDLTTASDDAKADFKDKLDKLSARIANTNKVTPNNPGAAPTAPELSSEQLREVLRDDDKFAQFVSDPKKFPVLSQMTAKKQ